MRVLYARILVQLDITKKLSSNIMVENMNGRLFKQKVYYEYVPFVTIVKKFGIIVMIRAKRIRRKSGFLRRSMS